MEESGFDYSVGMLGPREGRLSAYPFPRPHPLPVQKSGIHPWDEWGGRGLYQSQGEEPASEFNNPLLESGSYNPTGMMDPKYNDPSEVGRRRRKKNKPTYCSLPNSWQIYTRHNTKFKRTCRMRTSKRFYYDINFGRCLRFTRSHCPINRKLWNRNDFGTRGQCERTCVERYYIYTFIYSIISVRESFNTFFSGYIYSENNF